MPQPARDRTLLDAIAVHKISLIQAERKARKLSGPLWSVLRKILAPLASRHKSTFRVVISADPSDAGRLCIRPFMSWPWCYPSAIA